MDRLKPLKWYRSLLTSKGRREAGYFLIEGEKAVEQVLNNNFESVHEILATHILPLPASISVRILTESQYTQITSSKTPQGITALVKIPEGTYNNNLLPEIPGERLLLIENVQDPGNVGTLIRTAAAFNFTGVILSAGCADHFSPKCIQSTAGTILSVWTRRTPDYIKLIETLRQCDYKLIATDISGVEDTSPLTSNHKIILALGNEASGLTDMLISKADYRLRIPLNNSRVTSLNVASCGAICMYLTYHGK